MPTTAANVRVVRSLSSSACSSAFMPRAPVSARNASSSDRTRGARPSTATRSWPAISPTCSGVAPRTCRTSPSRCDPVAAALERAGQPGRVLRADLGRGAVVAAEHLLERALGAQLAVGDDDDVVDRLRDLGQDVAGDEHGARRGRPARAAGRAAS